MHDSITVLYNRLTIPTLVLETTEHRQEVEVDGTGFSYGTAGTVGIRLNMCAGAVYHTNSYSVKVLLHYCPPPPRSSTLYAHT